MKKLLFTFLLLFATNMTFVQARDSVILHPREKGKNSGEERPRRLPVAVPEAFVDEFILTFEESCIGCPITLMDEGENIVFTTVVNEDGIVTLPDTLTGIFELQLERGSITFVGEIEL